MSQGATGTEPGQAADASEELPGSGRVSAREINQTLRYTCWAVFARADETHAARSWSAESLAGAIERLGESGITVRGLYDVSAMRADADLLVWLHGPSAEAVQQAVRDIRVTLSHLGARLTWSAMGLHRPAEFNKGHIPAFMAGRPAQQWLVVYPFVRSYEWYLLAEQERREMLVEHGMMGREFPDVLTNTVAAFALGDYEWILALEGPQLHEIVDLMRHLRSSRARMHVRAEVPFFTGHLVDVPAAIAVLG